MAFGVVAVRALKTGLNYSEKPYLVRTRYLNE